MRGPAERRHIASLTPYQYGEQPTDKSIVKLNTNENPYPPSPAVETALGEYKTSALRRYPNPRADQLRSIVAQQHGLQPNQVLVTNGADEGIRLAITTFLDPGDVFLTTRPGYTLYDVLARIQDCRVQHTELTTDFDLPAHCAQGWHECGAKLVALVNPHAPTGRLFDARQIRGLLETYRGMFLIDEAYVDFVDPSCDHDLLPLLSEYANVLLLRTLSKGYGLAGLRVGLLFGPAALLEPIALKTRDSYNVDAIAQVLAEAAYTDQAYLRATTARIRSERSRLGSAFRSLGFLAQPSQTNFLLVQHPQRDSFAGLFLHLRNDGILVRYWDTPRLRDCIRITVGKPEDNEKLLASMRKFVDHAPLS